MTTVPDGEEPAAPVDAEPNVERLPATPDATPSWSLVVMAGIRVELPGEFAELLLRETEAPWRELAIPVGMADGKAIAYGWRGITTPRPLTHELFSTVLESHGVEVQAVRITERHGTRYVAELDTMGPGGHHQVSCRPSDAVAIALRGTLPTPILVAEHVFAADGDDADPA
jgi:bifunctional DNase/RNase